MSGETFTGLSPRTIIELEFFGELHPCGNCSAADWELMSADTVSGTQRVFSTTCKSCAAPRRYEVELPDDWKDGNIDLGTDRPSTIIGPDEFLLAADQAEVKLVDDPAQVHFETYFSAYGGLWRARRYLREVVKFIGPDDKRVAASALKTEAGRRAYDEDPVRFGRAAITMRVNALDVLEKKYEPLREEMNAARKEAKPVAPEPFNKQRYEAHQAWLDAGKTGDGRLVMEGNRITERMDAICLEGARFVKCVFVKTRFDSARLGGAEFEFCSGTGIFASTQLVRARFEHCQLSGSNLRRARLDNVTIKFGDWSKVALGRGELRHSEVSGVSFRDAQILDCVLDGTMFVDCDFRGASLKVPDVTYTMMGGSTDTRFVNCDFRGANFGDRKLERTIFDGCRFHGVKGKPRIQGPYTVAAPDFSPNADGKDVRDAGAVYALWGKPK